jgi:hypothetical protein
VTQGLEPIDFLLDQIELRHGLETEEYWEQAAAALANLTSPLEVERHLMPLAGKYPFMRDPERAARTLRQMVRKAARNRRKHDERPAAGESRPLRPVAMPPPLEAAPFRALAEPETRERAWSICLDEELFITESGRRLSRIAHVLRDALIGHEAGHELLEAIPDELDRDLFAAVMMLQEAPLGEDAIMDVGARLSKRKEEIELRKEVVLGSKTDEELRGLSVRLKELKGEKTLEKTPAGGLDSEPEPFV